MPSPSMHELLLHVGKSKDLNDLANLDLYILLKALVETVEPKQSELADAKATIESLRTRVENAVRGGGVVIETLRTELAEAKAEIERLDTECDRQAMSRKETEQELAEAKTKISDMAANSALFRASADMRTTLLAEARDRETQLNADAEIGRLVRGMQKHTVLMKTLTTYWAYWTHDSEKLHEWTAADHPWCRDDPAEALRAIQEVNDAEV